MNQITVTCSDLPDPDWITFDEARPGINICRARITDHVSQIAMYRSLLSEDELQRSLSYLHDKDRHRFIISRGLLRLLLAERLELLPEDIIFGRTSGKKPFVINATSRVIEFNVSHAGEWLLIALSAQPIGTDVECIDESFVFDDIVTQVFAEPERLYVNASPSPSHSFFKIWSRKECLLKGSGKGIGENLPLTICLDGINYLDSAVIGSPDNWEVNTFAVANKYVGNIAYSKSNPVNFFHIIPAAFDYLRRR
jgi:4'-phosphopantetheinyl transferase